MKISSSAFYAVLLTARALHASSTTLAFAPSPSFGVVVASSRSNPSALGANIRGPTDKSEELRFGTFRSFTFCCRCRCCCCCCLLLSLVLFFVPSSSRRSDGRGSRSVPEMFRATPTAPPPPIPFFFPIHQSSRNFFFSPAPITNTPLPISYSHPHILLSSAVTFFKISHIDPR